MFIANRQGTRYQDCASLPVTYYRDFLHDVANRTGQMLDGGQVFSVCRLALRCQAQAQRFTPQLQRIAAGPKT